MPLETKEFGDRAEGVELLCDARECEIVEGNDVFLIFYPVHRIVDLNGREMYCWQKKPSWKEFLHKKDDPAYARA